MQNKKSFKEELQAKQKSFLLIGMFVALGMSLMAFEWASFELEHIQVDELVVENLDVEPAVEMIQIEKPKPKQRSVVKEKEFNPIEDEPIVKVVDNKDNKAIDDPKATIDTNIGVDDIKIVDLGGGDDPVIEPITTFAEKMPQFPGGVKKMYEYLGNTIRYPEIDRQIGNQGKVYLSFVIEKNGSITDLNVIRGLSKGCDREAIKAIENMPKWTPGEQGGKKVRVRYTLPVYFKLK